MSYPLIAMFPEYALSILNYRYRFLPAAEQNARDFNVSGALYPWTGARFGNSSASRKTCLLFWLNSDLFCRTGVGPAYDYEYHLNSDIALAHIDYFYTIQNVTWLKERGYPVISAVADMWPTLVMKNASTQAYDVGELIWLIIHCLC